MTKPTETFVNPNQRFVDHANEARKVAYDLVVAQFAKSLLSRQSYDISVQFNSESGCFHFSKAGASLTLELIEETKRLAAVFKNQGIEHTYDNRRLIIKPEGQTKLRALLSPDQEIAEAAQNAHLKPKPRSRSTSNSAASRSPG